jgi:hypothetical protein
MLTLQLEEPDLHGKLPPAYGSIDTVSGFLIPGVPRDHWLPVEVIAVARSWPRFTYPPVALIWCFRICRRYPEQQIVLCPRRLQLNVHRNLEPPTSQYKHRRNRSNRPRVRVSCRNFPADGPTFTWMPYVSASGQYDINLLVPGCEEFQDCDLRTSVDVTVFPGGVNNPGLPPFHNAIGRTV